MSPPPPPTAIGVGRHAYCSLFHNVRSIISMESMHKHNFDQTLELQSAGYGEYTVKIIKI